MAGIPGRPKLWWQVAFNADPNDAGAVALWTNLTTSVRKIGQNRRGRMYELGQSLVSQFGVAWRDVNEYLNPANTSSPYYPNVVPYRQILGQGMWPNPDNDGGLGSSVNLINSLRWKGNNDAAPDPSFESYANGAAMPLWLTAVGSITGSITTTNPQQGTKSLTYTVAGTATRQGASWTADCVPGEQYTTSVYLRQSTGSTQRLMVGDQVLAYDNFGRSSSNGWGTADFGGAWSTANGSASDYSVSSSAGKHAINTLNVRRFTYVASTFVDVSEVITLSCPVLVTATTPASDAVLAGLHCRYTDIDNHYRAEIVYGDDGYIGSVGIYKRVGGVTTYIGTTVNPIGYLPYSLGQQYKLRFEVIGSSLRTRIWPANGIEPSYWHTTATDTDITAPGAIGCHTAASPGVTNTLPVTISFDSLMCSGADSSTSTTTSGSYVRLTRTFTATQPRHTITVATFGTATAGTINLDAIQHEPGASASTFTTSGPVIFPVTRSYVERWTRTWRSAGFEGMAGTPVVDGFAALNSIRILPDYTVAALALLPTHYWSMRSGSALGGILAEISGNDGPPLAAASGVFGAGTAPSFGSSVTLAGDFGATGVGFIPDQTVSAANFGKQAATVVGAGQAINGISGFVWPGFLGNLPAGLAISAWDGTVACWFKCTTKSPDNTTSLLTLVDMTTTRALISIGINVSGQPYVTSTGPSSVLSATGTGNYLDNQPHFLVGTIDQVNGGSTTVNIYIDGVLSATANVSTATFGGIHPKDANSISVGGLFDTVQMFGVANGTVLHVGLYSRELSSTEILNLYNAGRTGNNAELTGTRLARHFTQAPYVGTTRFSAGSTTLQPPTWSGSTDLLSEAQDIAVFAEGGTFWMGPDGAAVFEGRQDRWLRLTSQATFGEDTAAGEIPYLDGIEFDYDPAFVFANVQVTRSNGNTFFGGLAADVATATRKFFGRSYTETADYATDQQAQDKADFTFYTHRAPIQRVSMITVDPSSNPTIWPTIARLEVGQLVTVKRRAKAANGGAGLTMSANYFIETVIIGELDMDKGSWLWSYVLSPVGTGPDVTLQPWILDNTTYSVLDSTTVPGW